MSGSPNPSRHNASEKAISAGHSTSVDPSLQYRVDPEFADHTGRPHPHHHLADLPSSGKRFLVRLTGRDRAVLPTYRDSLLSVVLYSWTNALLVFLPLSWISHFLHWHQGITFAFSFVAILSLQRLFEFAGEEMAIFCGKSLGDLLVITLDNAVEITLAVVLLQRCELKLLQSTIVGVVLLHLLLATGASFFSGGARIYEQQLNPHATQLNHSLITLGVMTLLIPTAFFNAIRNNPERTASTAPASGGSEPVAHAAQGATQIAAAAFPAVSDETRLVFLKMSRGFAIILLIVYVGTRIYLNNPPGDNNALTVHPLAPEAVHKAEEEVRNKQPKLRPLVCVIVLLVTVPLMAATAEWLVDTAEYIRHTGNMTEEFFGLVVLPFVSFSADAVMSIVYFLRRSLSLKADPPELAEGRAIDLSIQFTLFWMPLLTLIGWWSHKPFSLLFDMFEVAIALAACFLVNYVTQDAKTNWAEGLIMVAFYFMIALSAWFYPGQYDIRVMAEACESVLEVIASGHE